MKKYVLQRFAIVYIKMKKHPEATELRHYRVELFLRTVVYIVSF